MDYQKIRDLALKTFGRLLCHSQVEIVQKLAKKKDVIACLPTGAGKTLTFWMPILMAIADGHQEKISFVVTPLNLLGKQNEAQLKEANVTAISISAKNAHEETF